MVLFLDSLINQTGLRDVQPDYGVGMRSYSVCISNWNSANTVRPWASSLLANLSEDDEVVIVDGESDDGSQHFLRELCQEHGFRFASTRAHVGRQRQLASELSHGEYIIAHVDTDDIVVSLQEAKRLYHEIVEWDPVTGTQRAFRCWGFFIIPRWMIKDVGGFPDLRFYEDQLLAYRLASRNWLTQSWKVSTIARGTDPKKRDFPFRLLYSFRRVREGLRLGTFDARNLHGFILLPAAALASLPLTHYEFRRDWWNLDVQRDAYILPWIEREHLSAKLLLEEVENAHLTEVSG